MGELVLASEGGFFLRDLDGEHNEAAVNFLQFLRDRGAYSDNTLRDLKLVLKSWATWCHSRGLGWFPISPDAVREYLLGLHECGLASTTTEKHYAMLNMMLKQCGQPSLSTSNAVSLVMRRIRREAVTENRERTGQAVPLQWDDLKLVGALLARSGRMVDLRNRAFLFVAYNTLLRMAEMSRIRVCDLDMIGDTVTIFVGHTKTSATAAGIEKRLSKSATAALNDWLSASGLANNPEAILFPPVHRSQKAKVTTVPLTAPALEKIFSDAWLLSGRVDQQKNKGRYASWTGHSARVGAAIDMEESGVSLAEIMREGTWRKPETVMRYLRRSRTSVGATSKIMDN
ncbi:tyrosine-type recombinase/integrase (plasmid) [Raoultella ornithinolytica]|uniref:tyrosine-type recombinase/integrase n=1 Tax=Raoultella ornithinolytica TaxID=54291 RepID=UPI00292B7894|nr:tyrosine-type recombinase/integrase [Raoultella ornithinolytica]MDV1095020.1 tyrosine-type recombinase/integrase [Raoultella ornithinolytica]MDV1124016.1 tyrosine-type recombinase/integrase [Raoultella ornithinolytica]MDV1894290.1 tyrosine-type recombinase/integrase [Raoultella ornithinolytica]